MKWASLIGQCPMLSREMTFARARAAPRFQTMKQMCCTLCHPYNCIIVGVRWWRSSEPQMPTRTLLYFDSIAIDRWPTNRRRQVTDAKIDLFWTVHHQYQITRRIVSFVNMIPKIHKKHTSHIHLCTVLGLSCEFMTFRTCARPSD